ncbi:MAG TPA: hypothetical protein VFI08_03645 [Spirochaetia bacterium]|nr:hypothetical protein [Spirochaetia bacterium]
MLPAPAAAILADLAQRYGQDDGTRLFNTLAEESARDLPLARRVYDGIRPHLSSMDVRQADAAIRALFAGGLVGAISAMKGSTDSLSAGLIAGFCRCRTLTEAGAPVPMTDTGKAEAIDPSILRSKLAAAMRHPGDEPEIGAGTLGPLFLRFFTEACRSLRTEADVSSALGLFLARCSGPADERTWFALTCRLLLFFVSVRRVPFERCWHALRSGLAPGRASSRELVGHLYDFFVDDRYRGKELAVLLSLAGTCIQAFYPDRRHLAGRVIVLLQDFIRISRAPGSPYVKTIFSLFTSHPELDLTRWVEEGARLIRKHGASSDAARAFFDRESDASRQLWSEIDSGISFSMVSDRLHHFANALAEKPVRVRVSEESEDSEEPYHYYTDGESVFVPPYVKYTVQREENYMVLLHSVAHECAHIEFGSFVAGKERCRAAARELDAMFPGQFSANQKVREEFVARVRQEFRRKGALSVTVRLNEEEMPDLLRLPFHSRSPAVMRFLWNVVEDRRVNDLLYGKYPGFSRERPRVDQIDFAGAPSVSEMESAHQVLAALAQQAWFGAFSGELRPAVQPLFRAAVDVLEESAGRVGTDSCDSMVAAGRILLLLADFPLPKPDYELSLLSGGRNAALSLEAHWLRQAVAAQGGQSKETRRGDGEARARAMEAIRKGMGKRPGDPVPPVPPGHVLYPEWDEARHSYQEDHCALFEHPSLSGQDDAQDDLLGMGAGLVASTRRAFQAMRPAAVTELRGQEDGHDLDFDRCVDSLLDLRAGHAMEMDFYVSRARRERSVASALVIDMSPSTREAVGGRSIFLHQKHAAHVMAQALDSLGDRFGIYSFYDFGPAVTLFFSLKELSEPFSPRIVERLDRFSPAVDGWSRCAVGLRHIICRLRAAEERSRVVFFITDGLPNYYEGTSGRMSMSSEYMIDGRTTTGAARVPVMEVVLQPDHYVRADLRKVREEAGLAGIHLFFVVLDAKAVGLFQDTFGSSLLFLPDVSRLPGRLLEVFRKLST